MSIAVKTDNICLVIVDFHVRSTLDHLVLSIFACDACHTRSTLRLRGCMKYALWTVQQITRIDRHNIDTMYIIRPSTAYGNTYTPTLELNYSHCVQHDTEVEVELHLVAHRTIRILHFL